MAERQVRISLIIDEHGAVQSMRTVSEEGEHTRRKLDELDKGVKGLGKSFGGLKTALAYGLGAAGLGSLVFGLKDIASTTRSIADETEKFHAMTGLGANSSLAYTSALKARGLTAEQGGNAFKFLSKNIEAAERQEHTFNAARAKSIGAGHVYTGLLGIQASAFQQLGINVSEFSRLGSADKLKLVTERFEALKDGSEKTALAVQILGRGGTALLPVLDKGALGLKHYLELTKKFFPTLKGEGVKSLEELREKQSESSLAWEGLQFTLGMKVVPVMTEVMSKASELALEIEHGNGAWGKAEKDIGGVATTLSDVVKWFERSKTALHGLEYGLETLAGAWGISKILGFTGALRGLAGAAAGEDAAFALAGGSLGTTLAIAFGAALVPAGAKVFREFAELIHPGSAKQHTLQEIMALAPGSAAEADSLHRKGMDAPHGPQELSGVGSARKQPKANHPTLSASGRGTEPAVHDRTVTVGGRTYYLNPGELAPGEAAPTASKHHDGLTVHTHVHVDGRQVAEAVTHYAQKKAARK